MKPKQLVCLLLILLSNSAYAKECVVLLHGLAKSHHSMEKLATSLKQEGYQTVNYDYPSRKSSIKALAQTHISRALNQCDQNAPIHFVTHSMGGILVRQYLTSNSIEHLGRVVMLGPPNQGSEVVDTLHALPGYALFGGPAALELGTSPKSTPSQLGPATFELGIIAGSRSINLLLSSLLPNQDDGKVSVARTKLSGMKAHLTLPVTHPFMMKNNSVITEVKHFLRKGAFSIRTL